MPEKSGDILIVDDNMELLVALRILLSPHFRTVNTLSNPNLIFSQLEKSSYDIILLDMNFSAGVSSGNEGLFWMHKIHEFDPDISVVFITAYGDVELAVKSMKKGAADFIQKSWEEDKILGTILSAYKIRLSKLEIKKLRNRQKHLNNKDSRRYHFCEVKSDAMKRVMETVDKVAVTDANVLILGENGTGKEVIAREIHKRSKRAEEIFVDVNISSLPESLFESEMFGHTKGAFTDAKMDRAGRFEIASGGTLFLDEIGDLALQLQSKLLSALQNRTVTRIGSGQDTPVDIRLISATNKNPDAMIREQAFREDLLYRINTIQIEIPPLRQRPEDIPSLVNYFIAVFSDKYKDHETVITKDAIDNLMMRNWQGNIRELQHAVEKAIILSESDTLTSRDFSFDNRPSSHYAGNRTFNLEENEKIIIQNALIKNNSNISQTARELGINRTTLYEKMKKYGI